MRFPIRLVAGAFALLFVTNQLTAEEVCSGCGCKGGPGYRGPNAQCVGWARLNKVCGNPPTKKCRAEGPALIALGMTTLGKAFRGDAGGGLPPTGAETPGEAVMTNQLRTKTVGVVCASVESLQALRLCPNRNPPIDCAGEAKALISQGACVELAADTPVNVQAGSRSFEWLKVRVGSRQGTYWADRQLLLAQ